MSPLPSPTSPFDSHPTTPLTPTFAHPLNSHVSSPLPSPRLKVVTNFPFQSILLLSPGGIEAPRPSTLKPVHKRNGSSVSTISFPSPAEMFFNHHPATPKTPGPTVSFQSLLGPGGPAREDGRQSRMAMRSPIVERVVSLPLRVNTSARTPPAEPSFPNPPNSVASSLPSNDTMSNSSPESGWLPFDPITPVIQISSPPSARSSHGRSGSTSTITQEFSRTPIGKPKRSRSPPPHYHMTVKPSLASTLNNPNLPRASHHPFATPALRACYINAVTHLSTPLVPLISVTSGLPHPQFPRSLLQYHLLTHHQLDSLARWYHQTEPATEESWKYPAWIPPYTNIEPSMARGGGNSGFEDVTLETKRRRWGRFIGLRGCESPTTEQGGEEQLVERMEREWLRAQERARDEEIAREKGWRGRW